MNKRSIVYKNQLLCRSNYLWIPIPKEWVKELIKRRDKLVVGLRIG